MPDKKNKIVCMISCCHHLLDDRIYKKEAVTLAQAGYELVHIGYGDCFEDYYTDDKIRIIQIEKLKKGKSLLSKVAAFRQLYLNDLFQAAKTVSADVYHLHDVELCRIALKLKKLPGQPKVIYDAHEPYDVFLKDSWRKRPLRRLLLNDVPSVLAESRILKKVDYLIATEENVASRFRKKNPHTAIIYNYSYFQPENSFFEKDTKEFDAVYCGSISETKGIFLMLDALIAAKKRGYDFKTVMVGDFNNPDIQLEVEKIIQKENLSGNLFFTGEIPLEEVSRYYKKSKMALCLFSFNRTNQLILPIKLFEYAAFGLPVIGSNFGHIAGIIQSDGIGICVNPHDAEEVADALIRLVVGDKYKEYIPLCIRCVKAKYSWGNQQTKLLRIYEELLNKIKR
ncbi:MAG: glycosyltransferase family 4 protein [Tannerella sp.]|jgi:glycosyltransferase involved in cell wall biosynthesis|nr:glycosyltransferase family 4 protein [Tannerella sp.]